MGQQKLSYPCPLDFDIQTSGRLKSPSLAEETVGCESARAAAGGCPEELPPWGQDAAPDTGHRVTGRGPEGRDGHCRADNPAMFMTVSSRKRST